MSSLTRAQRIIIDGVNSAAAGQQVDIVSTRHGPSKLLAILTVTSAMLGAGEAVAQSAKEGRVILRGAQGVVSDTAEVSRQVEHIQRNAEKGNWYGLLGAASSVLGVAGKYEEKARREPPDQSSPPPQIRDPLAGAAVAGSSRAPAGGGGYKSAEDFQADFGMSQVR